MRKSIGLFVCSLLIVPAAALADTYQPMERLGWASFRNLSVEDYEKKLDEYEDQGYLPVDVEVTVEGAATLKYAVIFRKNSKSLGWKVKTRLSDSEFHDKWEEYKSQGFLPVDIETYVVAGQLRFGAIWHQNKDGRAWSSRRKLSSDEFHEWYEDRREKGFRPIDVDGVSKSGDLLFSGVFVKNVENLKWEIRRNVPQADYHALFEEFKGKGLRPYDLDGYTHGGKLYFATIWVDEDRAWAQRRDMNGTSFHNWWAKYRDRGYRLDDIDVYATPDGVRYAGVWVSNKLERLNWKHKDAVADLGADWCKDSKSMGCAVAVAHDGQIRFVRGFGYADKDGGEEAHGGTLFRLASVAKAVTATLGFVLEDKGKVNLEIPVRDVLSGLPKKHGYDIEDLLSNRSLVRHYIDDDPTGDLGQVDSAWEAVEEFMDDDLVDDDDGYLYSTHAYTIFAAVVEKKLGGKFCSALKTHLSKPHGVSKLRCQDGDEDDASDRSKLYDQDGDEKSFDNLSWKYAGGGMEANAAELARFGVRLHQNEILSATRLSEMTTKPDDKANYAFGWVTGSHDGWSYFAKDGSQTGSNAYLRVYPAKKLVIVALSNTKGGGGTGNLTKAIAKKVLSP